MGHFSGSEFLMSIYGKLFLSKILSFTNIKMTGKNPEPKDHNRLRILFRELEIRMKLEIQIIQEKLYLLACLLAKSALKYQASV